MAGAWAGFSEQELRRLQERRKDPPEPRSQQRFSVCSANKSRQHGQQRKLVQEKSQEMELPDGAALSPLEQRHPESKVKDSSPQLWAPEVLSAEEQQGARTQEMPLGLEESCNGDLSAESSHKQMKKKMELQEKSRWEILQQEQKLMEEKNKRKKALLAKAIAERSRRTQAEAVKLKRIQLQLQALDDMVSADIGILRNKIDQASLEYSCARKRYDKAEGEYVAAKLDLQKKTEVKEQLTEHLCTIIQQNELRKAKKLEELMQQLEVEADEENLELEIEVEQMLQQQEAEGKKRVAESQDLVPVGADAKSSEVTSREHENKRQTVSEELLEQPGSSNMNGQDQKLNSVSREMVTCDGT